MRTNSNNMNAEDFYNTKDFTIRTLHEGNTIRNSHNFIKACLINTFITKKKRILDLGCGQGGDLIKIKFTNPSFYVGIDVTIKAITAAKIRCKQIKLNCRNHFICCDFCKHDWQGYAPYDIVNCQFAIHFAFKSQETALFTISRISKYLNEDGFFIGTVPVHPGSKTYEEVTVSLPDDERSYTEYCAQKEDLIQICEQFNLKCILFECFTTFYNSSKHKYPELHTKMKAFTEPDKNNNVFAFQKRTPTPVEK